MMYNSSRLNREQPASVTRVCGGHLCRTPNYTVQFLFFYFNFLIIIIINFYDFFMFMDNMIFYNF